MKALIKIIIITLLTFTLFACERHPENQNKESKTSNATNTVTTEAPAKTKVETLTKEKTSTEAAKDNVSTIKVGIIVPLEHKALQEIVAGFSEKLRQLYPHPLEIKVMNAQGDINIQRAIIQQMRDEHYNLIVPVATGVTQMTASMVHDQPIISLAADFSDKDRQQLKPCNIVVVHDDIPATQIVTFIHAAYPQIKHLVLIHSTSDKIYPDVKAAVSAGKQNGMDIKPIMVATLPELVSATQALPANTQGIFVLKDNLIVSGISTLAKTAEEKHIPLITSDQGSVQVAAGFALGVYEREIGEAGAKLAAAVLAGDAICSIPIVEMKKDATIFINKTALEKEKQATTPIESAAKKLNYSVEYVKEEK